jgi:hypothetical protein
MCVERGYNVCREREVLVAVCRERERGGVVDALCRERQQ